MGGKLSDSIDSIDKKYVLIIMYPACTAFEVMLAAELCSSIYDVRVATLTGSGHRGSNGIKIEADMSVEGFNSRELETCVGILIPGGDPYDLIEGSKSVEVGRLLTTASHKSIPIGAICAAPAVLGKHGLLKAKRFTHGFGDTHKEFLAPIWEGAVFTDRDVEVDGDLITAKAQAHVEFATTFALKISAIDTEVDRVKLMDFYKNSKPLVSPTYIDHTTIAVSDLAVSKTFYESTFKSIGARVAFGEDGVFWAFELDRGLFEIRLADKDEAIGRVHVAIRVASHDQVGAFYAAGLKAGGVDNGAPGPRPQYTPGYYACFLKDPDGHNIEALYDLD